MANRNTNRNIGTLERATTKLYLKATFASGVATIVRGKGIKSFAKNDTGDYDITFGSAGGRTDKYSGLLAYQGSFITESGLSAAPICSVKVDLASSGVLNVGFANNAASPALTDPGDGDTLLLEITLLNTSAY